MFVRTMYVTGDPAEIEGAIERLRNEGVPAVSKLPGFKGVGLFVDRELGKLMSGTWWESEQAERESDAELADKRAEWISPFARTLTVDRWEAAFATQPRPQLTSGGFRMNRVDFDPEQLDRAVQAFKDTVAPGLQEIDGFVGTALLVNRADGRGSVGMLYRDRAALIASRGPQARVRGEGIKATGAVFRSMEELEVVLVQ